MGFLRILMRLFSGKRKAAVYPKDTGRKYAPIAASARRHYPTTIKTPTAGTGTVLQGRCWVIDGDTIVIDNVRLRLAGIDAPELDHPWGKQAKWGLVQLCKGEAVTARIRPQVSYG